LLIVKRIVVGTKQKLKQKNTSGGVLLFQLLLRTNNYSFYDEQNGVF
jgi:hypothetical protein